MMSVPTRALLFTWLMFALSCDAPELSSKDKPVAKSAAAEQSPAASNAAAEPPVVPDDFVFRPTFGTVEGPIGAGTAFVATLPGQPRQILLSAIHLLGPSGGFDRDIPAAEVGRFVTELAIDPCFNQAKERTFKAEAIPILEAAPHGAPSTAGDVIAFWMPRDATTKPLPLASAAPPPGTRVWLAAALVGGAPDAPRLHGATVADVQKEGLVYYSFDNAELSLQATSGAPVLNAEGQVVAINLAGGTSGGRLFGVGNPVEHFRPYLEKAIGDAAASR